MLHDPRRGVAKRNKNPMKKTLFIAIDLYRPDTQCTLLYQFTVPTNKSPLNSIIIPGLSTLKNTHAHARTRARTHIRHYKVYRLFLASGARDPETRTYHTLGMCFETVRSGQHGGVDYLTIHKTVCTFSTPSQ